MKKMKKKFLALLQKKEAKKTELGDRAKATESIEELRSINGELDTLNTEIEELRAMADTIPDETPPASDGPEKKPGAAQSTERTAVVNGAVPGEVIANAEGEERTLQKDTAAEERAISEKRGKELKENRAVTIGSATILVPTHYARDIRPTFSEVSTLLDRVYSKPLTGGESFKQPYLKGYGIGGYTAETIDYTTAEPTFGYASIIKAKVTAYAEDTEELQKLPAADYDSEVMRGIRVAARKKITRDILIGSGDTNSIAGIFSDAADAIDPGTDLKIAEIDEDTLDEIIYGFGGDEDVEDAAVLILNKKDLAAFAKLRTAEGRKLHEIKTNGNVGTINGYPFIINSACKAISDPVTGSNDFAMAYGPLSNYMLCIFSDMDVRRSEDYKFKQGMLAHRGSIFLGGNVVSYKGFLRVKKQ